MPGPPPPPPSAPPPMMPPPPAFIPAKGGGGDDRAALLKSIQKGAKLKKTVTNDKSAPMIGKVVSSSNNNTNSSSSSSNNFNNSTTPNGLGLGGLFAGGMPKLRPTGKFGTANGESYTNNNNNSDNVHSIKPRLETPKSNSSIQNELKKQLASDNRNRGPPPPAPIRNLPEDLNSPRHPPLLKNNSSSNGISQSKNTFQHQHSNSFTALQPNNTALHRKAKSNANLSSLDTTDSMNGESRSPIKPVINHGKPNLAPKPPGLSDKGPPRKLMINGGKAVSRAQSMKSPRSPSPQSPATDMSSIKFGTVRNVSAVLNQTLGSPGSISPRPRPPLNGRPPEPPPSIPSLQQNQTSPHLSMNQTPLPPSKTNHMRPPNHAPPPPPSIPQPPTHAPPLPPSKTQTLRPTPPPHQNSNNAPPPPPRHCSMREPVPPPRMLVVDLEERYRHMFNKPNTFPKAPPYRNVTKVYSNRQAGSKQQAPPPPSVPTNRPWTTSAGC